MNAEPIRAAYQRFPHETLSVSHTDHRGKETARALHASLQIGVLMSLGATDLGAVAGAHQLGGLLFTARIFPLRHDTRLTAPTRMGIMISLTPADSIDIHALEYARGTDHAHINDVHIDQLNTALLSLDYDGPTAPNPRYWP